MQHYQRIRDLREDSDLTQKQLCEKLYMNKTTYVNYEQGNCRVPLDFAVTLADFYCINLDYLAGRTNIKEKFISDKIKKEKLKNWLTHDELQLIEQYRELTERSKGRLEQFIETLLENQKK